jgi:hypothetical protein
MRLLALLLLIAAPASAQSILQPDTVARGSGPNAEAARRPLGPNAQVMERRATGPNTELARSGKPANQSYYPSCAAAGAARSLPVKRGEPGYGRHLDHDGDGVACE